MFFAFKPYNVTVTKCYTILNYWKIGADSTFGHEISELSVLLKIELNSKITKRYCI